MKSLLFVLLSAIFVFNAACIKKSTNPTTETGSATAVSGSGKLPEDVVKVFLELSAQAKEDADRKRLLDLCSGEMRKAFERMTSEAFRLTYLNNNVKVKSIKILETKLDNNLSRVRYQITVENNQGTDPTTEINEREVDLVKTEGDWRIDTIRPKGSDQIAFTRGMIF